MHAHADGRLAEAARGYRAVLNAYPHLSRVAYNLGNICQLEGGFEEAEGWFRQALGGEPDLFEAAQNLAFVLQEQGRYPEALELYERILERWPGLPDPRFNLACLQLLRGDFPAGWQGYEARFDCLINPVPRRHGDLPRWSGNIEPDLRLLIHTEQGFGDTLQMSRYLPLVAATGAQIILETDAPLAPFLSRSPHLLACIVRGHPLPPVDAQVPLMSLPGLFNTTLATIPPPVLSAADPRLIAQFAAQLPGETPLRVGLCWSGRLDLPVNRKRSCPVDQVRRLLDAPDCCFISLQATTAPVFNLTDPRLLDLTAELDDFHATAALIASLDLVISIDTAVAHLAGSMGKPVWLLLPFVPDWRWLLERDDSPWYPSMRLFRQPSRGAWTQVIDTVLTELTFLGNAPAESLTNKGALLGESGCHTEALRCYNEALLYRNDIAVTHYNRGNSLLVLGRVQEARNAWHRALELNPKLVEAWHNLAISHRDQGDIKAAHTLLQQALQLHPQDPELQHTRGELFQAEERFEEAIASFRQSLAVRPESARTWNSLGTVYQSLEQDPEAEQCYRTALTHDSRHLHARNNLGAVLLSQGRAEEAIPGLELLIADNPDYYDGHWNLACALLASGHWSRGWQAFEYRFLKHSPVEERYPEIPRWDGSSPLRGKTVLLVAEQAFGDTIQFVRFIPPLAALGAQVILECQAPPLVPLMRGQAGVTDVICRGDVLPPVDWRIPLLSLPLLLKTAPEAVAAMVPYLQSFPIKREEWRRRLADDGRLRVGLCWWGRQTLRNRRRSCPPDLLAPLAEIPGVTLHRLQLGGDDPPPPFELIDQTGLIHDFSDTAALISCLDLVITIDTAVAHLAGALGIPVWLLLPATGDWRWMTGQEDSPWYPGMRIFRQRDGNGWQPVVARLAAALSGAVAGQEDARYRTLLDAGDRWRAEESWEQALTCYLRAAAWQPAQPLASLRVGACLIFLNRHDEATVYLQRASARQPAAPDPHLNLAICHFALGQWQQGWQEFEWRRRTIVESLPPIPELPPLAPGARLDGSSVLVHCEQGFGDMLQFCRYLPLLTQLGAQVVCSTPQELVRLFRSLDAQITVIPHGELLPTTDYQTLLMSLPGLLQTLQPGPLVREAYLAPPLACLEAARALTDNLPGIKVGLAWQGRNLGKSGYRRSLDAVLLQPLLDLEGCSFVSLHPQPVHPPHPSILDLSDRLKDFADTAALMAQLDLVITVDTAVAHLAGALGIPCWVALLHAPDWRWFPLDNAASRWYPSVRLFRQGSPGDWEGLIQRIRLSLQEELLTRKGHQLVADGAEAAAVDCFRAATAHQDASAAAWLNLGTILQRQGASDEARGALQRALQRDPGYPEAWQNLGLVQQALGDYRAAYRCFRQALRLRPDYPTARWNLALLQLLLGDYRNGFQNYEARFDKQPPIPRLHRELPLWDGSTSLQGVPLLVHAEQGYGDTIQFCRYLPILCTMGADVVFEVQDHSLAALMRSLSGQVAVAVRGEAAPTATAQIPLLSLPRLLQTTPESIPAGIPYLFADTTKVAAWRQRLSADSHLKVGLVWQGSRTHLNDRFRSCPPQLLTPFAALPGVAWYLLQPDLQGYELPFAMYDLTADIHDFSDTAALLAQLDLVITVDTALAHLAGALGRPTWLLLPFAPDWRWGATGTTSPWYPGMRIFRQGTPGDWEGPLVRIRTALAELAARHAA